MKKRYHQAKTISTIFLSAIVFLLSLSISTGETPSHLDRSKNPLGCGACHRGHGKRGTMMLAFSKQEFCFSCHGLDSAPPEVRAKKDILAVFNKRFNHPVEETAHFHVMDEELPETNSSTPRHVACADCHRTHVLTSEKPWRGVKGYTKGLAKGREAEEEYELCYKCHSDSPNLPYESKNMRILFSRENPSYHPIETYGKTNFVPSLIRPLNVSSTIKCSDCHGNDNPFGPQGPHGSDYEHLLIARYETHEIGESESAYELCYICHDRSSILDNQSFQSHREHVVFNNVPCSACHTPHGSTMNPHLIEFDEKFLDPTVLPVYFPAVGGSPKCLLNCHIGAKSVVHDEEFYTEGTEGVEGTEGTEESLP
jgi:predicted CXXCH cytochrome family protein